MKSREKIGFIKTVFMLKQLFVVSLSTI